MKKPTSKISVDEIYQLEHYMFELMILLEDVNYVKFDLGIEKTRSLLKELSSVISYIKFIRKIIEIPNEKMYVGFNISSDSNHSDLKVHHFYSKEIIHKIFKIDNSANHNFVKSYKEAKEKDKPGWYFMEYNAYLRRLFGNYDAIFFNHPLEVSHIKLSEHDI